MKTEKPFQGDPQAPEAPQLREVFKRGRAGTHFGSRVNFGERWIVYQSCSVMATLR